MLNNRNEQALAAIEAGYGALCRALARQILGSEQDAEECMNDALLAVWNAIPPAQPENLRAYLLKTVRNLALDRARAANREKRGGGQYAAALDEIAEFLPDKHSTEDAVEQREMLAAVTQFLGTLPEKQKAIFVRRYWYFATYEALAEELGMTVNHVKVTVSRVRKKLEIYLRKEGLL